MSIYMKYRQLYLKAGLKFCMLLNEMAFWVGGLSVEV